VRSAIDARRDGAGAEGTSERTRARLKEGQSRRRFPWVILAFVFLLLWWTVPAWAEEELTGGLYFTIVDEKNQSILETGLVVNVGDQVLLADNRIYEVFAVDSSTHRAQARFLRQVSFRQPRNSLLSRLVNWGKAIFTEAGRGEIAIYHTHTDESYIPTDGTAAKPAHGSVMKVGDTFSDALTKLGFTVSHDKTPHDPHDAMAYERSRRTAMKLLQKKPVALFDVHRDSAPASAYATQVGPAKATKVMIVVGRQNPNMQANLAFAQRLKAEVDRTHPGLIRGIFFGKGKYNQDLFPRALILEVGSEKNSLEEAEKGIAALAEAVPKALAGGPGQAAGTEEIPFAEAPAAGEERGSYAALWWIIGLLVAGGVAYYLLAAAGSRRRRVAPENRPAEDLTDALGLKSKEKDNEPDTDRKDQTPPPED